MKKSRPSRVLAIVAALVLCASSGSALARHGSGHGYYASNHSHGSYHRSSREKHEFEATGHPHGWPGHVVDHITPLACGGADVPSNMQWQTRTDAKAKDKWERRGCKR